MKKFLLIFAIIFSQCALAQSDCISAIPLCGNSSISYTPTGPGNILEDLGGCLSTDEHFSVWYSFTTATAGTFSFTINPNVPSNDYDFGVYGPNPSCAALGTPIRCNYSGVSGPTGLSATQTGSQWSPVLNVQAGETYYLVVDNYTNVAQGFTLTFGGTAALTSPFLNPTIQPFPFIAPGPNADGELIICSSPATYDFAPLSPGIINGNPDFTVSYHLNANDALTNSNPILTPINVNTATTYYYVIHYLDSTNPTNAANNCTVTGEIHFIQGAITVNNATLTACSNNNSGVGLFDLTSANVFADIAGTSTYTYYPTLQDLNSSTNAIVNPAAYNSAQGDVYVKVLTVQGCTGSSKITLQFFPPLVQTPATMIACFIEANPTTGLFNLTTANVTTTPGVTKKYYLSQQDAVNNTNPIGNPLAYIATTSEVFVRITSTNTCWNVIKINLTVTPPKYSVTLKDKIICIEDTTTLNAGAGFTSYLWNTGATTSSISDVSVGSYYVDLTTDGCVTRQTVKVLAAPLPVITNIEISNNTVTVTASGGTLPYKYSLDGITFQDSNVFTDLPRGQNSVYIKDAYDCDPIMTDITVPNLVNAITPNGDGVNDVVDYGSLSFKKGLVFSVYDRYGNNIHIGDKNNRYTWNGTKNGGKKVPTGTYWYTITWNEPAGNAEVKYSGWILVKSRD